MNAPRWFDSSKPFESTYQKYGEQGWDVVPLPPRKKKTPPPGFTGRINIGNLPTEQDYQHWINGCGDRKCAQKCYLYGPNANIAVHVGRRVDVGSTPYEVIGIDIDDYNDKNGWAELEAITKIVGPLPDTWISSARVDQRSGHRYFLVPHGYEFHGKPKLPNGKAAESIEIIQHKHRYGLCFPSWNSEADSQYYWYEPGHLPNGQQLRSYVPNPTELSVLPEEWFVYLREGMLSTERVPMDSAASVEGLQKWATETFGDPKNMCPFVQRVLAKKLDEIANNASHHDPLTNGQMYWLHCAAEGHTGWMHALRQMENAWLDRSIGDGSRSQWVAKAELLRGRDGALRKTKGAIDAGVRDLVPNDPCKELFNSKVPLPDSLAHGQLRLAARMVEKYYGKMIFVPNVGWHYWDGKRWKIDELSKIFVAAQFTLKASLSQVKKKYEEAKAALAAGDVARSDELTQFAEKLAADVKLCQSRQGLEGMVKVASVSPKLAHCVEELDSNPWLLNMENCTLDLKTGATHPHNPDNLITRVCNARYDPKAKPKCPKWLKFLKEVLPDEDVRKFLATLMGVSLVGTQIEHMLVIFYGNGRNGKGVTEEVMRHTLGDYGVPAASDLFTAKQGAHTTSQTDLMSSRLAIIDETESNASLNEALVKNMTGGGTHVARRMKKDNIRFPKTWLAVMITNHLPTITGDSIAIWDRLVLVVFPRFFELNERNKNLREELKEEADGIFLWAYEAWKTYQDNDYKLLQYPESIVKALRDYRHDHDKVQKWLDDRCQTGTGDLFKTKSVDLQADYENWRRTEPGAEMLSSKGFVAAMKHKNFHYERQRSLFNGIRLDPGREKLRVTGVQGEGQ